MGDIDLHTYLDIKTSNTCFFSKFIILINIIKYNCIGDNMNKKYILIIIGLVCLLLILFLFNKKDTNVVDTNSIEAVVLYSDSECLTIQDKDNIIYTFNNEEISIDAGTAIILEYSGILDKNKSIQTGEIIDYVVAEETNEEFPINDKGIFNTYYQMAYDKLKELTLDEKIGQLFLVRYPDSDALEDLKKYKFGGFVFFEKDFKDKTKQEVINMIEELQNAADIPLLTAVDEEGGKIVRISSNPNLRVEAFKSSQDLYAEGGFDLIKEDTKEKSELLKSLGINLNLAPVVDVSTDESAYMYPRTLGENASLTSQYAKTVIEASKGTDVSYTLKHFPGYGNNTDTHIESSTDTRTYEEILNNDILPFKSGIDAGAEAVLVSHNIVTSIDADNPASLSPTIHNLLRNELGFTGVIITDNLDMSAVSSIDNLTIEALTAGNDLIITTDYEKSINDVKTALNDGTIGEALIDRLVFRNLAWKYYKGLMIDSK